jgi:recombination associated protein RdgC
MGFRKGALTFSRYRLIGDLPDHFPAFFDERIRKNAFQNVWRTSDEKAMGWTALDDPLDTDFPYASYAQGRYQLFSMRIDRKALAPALLRLRVLEAERKQLADTGQKRLYREQREAIREAVRLDLLGKSLPTPSLFEICWSVPDHTLILGSLSDKVFEELQELFRDSFQIALCPYLPWDQQPRDPQQIPEPSLPAGVDPLSIGREFLTWLWFKSEERSGKIQIPNLGEVEVLFVRRLVLESGDGEYAEQVVCQGMHADLKEGKEALRQGKKITAARLRVAHDKTEWEFTLKADRFHFQSMKLPTLPEGDEEETDREGQLLERIYLIEKVTGLMDQLFGTFMTIRLSGDWAHEQGRMEKWLR